MFTRWSILVALLFAATACAAPEPSTPTTPTPRPCDERLYVSDLPRCYSPGERVSVTVFGPRSHLGDLFIAGGGIEANAILSPYDADTFRTLLSLESDDWADLSCVYHDITRFEPQEGRVNAIVDLIECLDLR